jgi:hypothetical protein
VCRGVRAARRRAKGRQRSQQREATCHQNAPLAEQMAGNGTGHVSSGWSSQSKTYTWSDLQRNANAPNNLFRCTEHLIRPAYNGNHLGITPRDNIAAYCGAAMSSQSALSGFVPRRSCQQSPDGFVVHCNVASRASCGVPISVTLCMRSCLRLAITKPARNAGHRVSVRLNAERRPV